MAHINDSPQYPIVGKKTEEAFDVEKFPIFVQGTGWISLEQARDMFMPRTNPPHLNHFMFIMEPHDYQVVIDALIPLTRNEHCEYLAKELITALSRAQEGKIFHVFAEVDHTKGQMARHLHNDPEFARRNP
jgi:hypothetical protein